MNLHNKTDRKFKNDFYPFVYKNIENMIHKYRIGIISIIRFGNLTL